jgi:hypothetical protein
MRGLKGPCWKGTSKKMSDTDLKLQRYRRFVEAVYEMCAGGPPVDELIASVEDGTVNLQAVGYMQAGFPFESFTEPLQVDPNGKPIKEAGLVTCVTLDSVMESKALGGVA